MSWRADFYVSVVSLLVCSLGSAAALQQSAAASAALADLRAHASDLGVTPGDVGDLVVTSEGVSSHTNVTHVYVRQRYRGIDVWRADMTVNVGPDGAILNRTGAFVPGLARAASRTTPVIDAVAAFRAAAAHLDLPVTAAPRVVRPPQGPAREGALRADVSVESIPVRLTFWPQAGGRLHLAWQLEIELRDGSHRWLVLVDAETGKVLEKQDLVVSGKGFGF